MDNILKLPVSFQPKMAPLVNKCLLIPLWQCSRVTFTTDVLYVSPSRVTFYIYLSSPELWSKKCITHAFFFLSPSLPGNSVRFLQKCPCNTTTGTKELHPKSLAGACCLLSLTVSWGQRGVMLPASLSSLLPGTLMILKSACSNNSSYIDRLISVFMRSLQKMVREHLSPQPNPGAAETSTGDHPLDSCVKDVFPPKIHLKLFHLK